MTPTTPPRVGTIALVIRFEDQRPVLLDSFSDELEIARLEKALAVGTPDPLTTIYQDRERHTKEDQEFGDYVEELLSQPFVRPEIQEHGLQWLKSKIRLEQFHRRELEATKVIAEHALKIYQTNRDLTDFILAGPISKVRIRIFAVDKKQGASDTNAA